MALQRISLFDMAEAVGDVARSARLHVEIWDRDHPGAPLPADNQWVILAETLEAAHRGFALLSLKPDEAVALINKIKSTDEGKMLVTMLTAPKPKAVEAKADAAEPSEAAA